MSKVIIISIISLAIIFSTFIPSINAENVPSWIKNTAGWWATDTISEDEFVNAIEFLVKVGIIVLNDGDDRRLLESDSCNAVMHEILKDIPQDVKNQRCNEVINSDYVFDRVNISTIPIHINSHGFRGDEITLEKPENTYRIFMIGGSTTYGDGIENENTMPVFLQKEFELVDLGFDVQVINAGIPKASSYEEVELIKNRLFQYNPDLFVVYDGWNDSAYHMAGITDEQKWFDRWDEICNLGKDNGFDVIVTIQPIAGTGDRIITQQEYDSQLEYESEVFIAEIFPLYLEKLHMLNDCIVTADLTGIFDNVSEPVYYDHGHQGARGSEIIAKNMFKLIIPILTTNHETIVDMTEMSLSKSSYKPSNITPKDFLATMPEELDWSQESLLYRNYSGQDLRNLILWDAENLKHYFAGSNLYDANLAGVDLSGWDFTKVNLEKADLSYAKLDDTKFQNANLHNAKLEGSTFPNIDWDVRGVILSSTDLPNAEYGFLDLTLADFTDSDLSNSFFNYTTFLESTLIRTDLSGSDLSYASLAGGVVDSREFSDGTKGWKGKPFYLDPSMYPECSRNNECASAFVNEIYSFRYFVSADLSGSTLIDTNLSNSIFVENNFNDIIAENADFSYSFILNLPFKNADLRNTSFEGSYLDGVDFENADLRNANFEGSYLSNVDFENADLSGADFTWSIIVEDGTTKNSISGCIGHPICD